MASLPLCSLLRRLNMKENYFFKFYKQTVTKNKSQIYVDHEMKSMASLVRDLNSRPLVYKTSALATELTRLTQFFLLNLYNF